MPAPSQVFTASHAASVVTVQAPARSQQAPVGCEQRLGEQFVSAPCQVPGAAHAASIVTVQVPAGAQQAPVAIPTPIPLQPTISDDVFPITTGQLLLPVELG